MKIFFTAVIVLLFSLSSIASEKIKASFKADKQSGALPLSVLFEGMENTTGVSYNWDFGNGSTSMRKTAITMFVNPGTYTVKLTVTNGTEIDSSFMSIDVLPNPDVINTFRPKPRASE